MVLELPPSQVILAWMGIDRKFNNLKDSLYLDCFFENEMKAQKLEFLEIFEYLRLLDSSLACATSPFNLVIKV